MRLKLLTLFTILPFALVALVACGGDDDTDAVAENPYAAVTAVSREVFSTGAPETAPGEELAVSRVVIPAGDSIARDTHPGMQIAVIEQGVLTYTVHEGEVLVRRAGGTPPETYGPGTTTNIKPGDSLVEAPGMVHDARNDGDVPVVIYLSSLFTQGLAPSTPVD